MSTEVRPCPCWSVGRRLRALDAAEQQARADTLRSPRTAITETESKSKRLLRNLELVDAPDPDFVRDINERRAESRVHKQSLTEQMAELEDQVHQAPNPDLLSRLPVAPVDLSALPDDLSRRLFEALRLEIHYDGVANEAVCRITLTGDTIDAVARATHETAATPLPQDAADRTSNDRKMKIDMTSDRDLATICAVPPTGSRQLPHEPSHVPRPAN